MPFGNIKKNILRIFSVEHRYDLKKYHPLRNMKFNNLGIFQSLKFCILMGKKSFQFHSKYFGLLWVKYGTGQYWQ